MRDLEAEQKEKTTRVQTSGEPHELRISELFDVNVEALQSGSELLSRIPRADYVASCRPVFLGTIGAHFRHLLEHYQCFVQALEQSQQTDSASGCYPDCHVSVCYDARTRDMTLERDPSLAQALLERLVTQLGEWSGKLSRDQACYARDQEAIGLVTSTLSRELLFLQTHTIHHYAMLAAMCRIHRIKVNDDFGVAVSTRTYMREQNASFQWAEG